VEIFGPTGSLRIFQPDSRRAGTYFSQAGDYGTLTALSGGAFSLQEAAGFLYTFRSDGALDYVQDTNNNRITCGYTGSLPILRVRAFRLLTPRPVSFGVSLIPPGARARMPTTLPTSSFLSQSMMVGPHSIRIARAMPSLLSSIRMAPINTSPTMHRVGLRGALSMKMPSR
jgi:hypothetical protein